MLLVLYTVLLCAVTDCYGGEGLGVQRRDTGTADLVALPRMRSA